MPLSPVWQSPFVNVFRLCNVEQWKDASKEGEVSVVMDKLIGKRVLAVKGTIPAANYVQIPRFRTQNLGLNGRFVYLQVRLNLSKYFMIHLDVLDRNHNVHRVSISNLYRATSDRKNTSGLQLALPNPSPKWTVLAVDLEAAVACQTTTPFECLKALQLCAWLSVRGVFTSDLKYSLKNLPKDMVMSNVPGNLFCWTWLPCEPADVPEAIESPDKALPYAKVGSVRSPTWEGSPHAGTEFPGESKRSSPERQYAPLYDTPVLDSRSASPDPEPSPAPAPPPAPPPKGAWDDEAPLLQLQRMNGFTGEYPRAMLWNSPSDELVFACASVIICMKSDGSRQRFLQGHSAGVCSVAASGDGVRLVSGQEGKHSLVRLWDLATGTCEAVLCGHAGGMVCVDIAPDGRTLVAVGMDAQSRQLIVMWDISEVSAGEKAQVLVKATTEYNVRCAKFCPFDDPRRIVTCGKDSVRLWRLKGGRLHGLSVRMGDPVTTLSSLPTGPAVALGNNIYTDVAFEVPRAPPPGAGGRLLFVASVSGAVFQINYDQHCLESAYQLHNGAINSIALSHGFCVTGSDDNFLRLWPIDFSDFFLEAEHEAVVTAVGLNADGLRVAVGTENGSVGVLDVASHAYTTLLRSHSDSVLALALERSRRELCSGSADGTIRVWSLDGFQQLYEFDAPGEVVTCLAYHPQQSEIACGFQDGLTRVFDIAKTSLVQELRQHQGAVQGIHYTASGERLLTLGTDGNVCLYDVINSYLPLKFIDPDQHRGQRKVAMAVSSDDALLAIAAQDRSGAAELLLYRGPDLVPHLRLATDQPGFTQLAISADATEVVALTLDNALVRYCAHDGSVIQCLAGVHRDHSTALALDPLQRCIFTGGQDTLLKVWEWVPRAEVEADAVPSSQSFVGHSGAVHSIQPTADGCLATADASDTILFWTFRVPDQSRPQSPPAEAPAAANSPPLPPKPQPSGPPLRSGLASGSALQSGHGEQAAVPELRRPATPSALSAPLVSDAVAPSPAAAGEVAGGAAGGAARLACEGVVGFSGTAQGGMFWQPSSGLFCYVVDNVVVLEQLHTRQQSYLSYHSKHVSALAVAPAHSLAASGACAPSAAGGGTADIVLWDLRDRSCRKVLQYHPCAVQALAFSADGLWLVSMGRDPERSVVVWDVASGEPVAVGRTRHESVALAWRTGTSLPEFVSVGKEGALHWALEPSHLAQQALQLPRLPESPPPAAWQGCTAVACDDVNRVFVGEAAGMVWQCVVGSHGSAAAELVAHLPGQAITCLEAAGSRLAVGTSERRVRLYERPGGEAAEWRVAMEVELDGQVGVMAWDAGMDEGLAGTANATIWYLNVDGESRVPLLSGHASTVTSLAAAPCDEALVASTADDGVLRVWQTSSSGAAPLLELESPQRCTSTAWRSDGQRLAAGYADGTLRVFDLASVSILWTAHWHSHAVVGLAFSSHLGRVLSVSRDSSVAVSHADDGRRLQSCDDLQTHATLPVDDVAVSGGAMRMCAAAWRDRLLVFVAPWEDSACRIVGRYHCPAQQAVAEPPEARAAVCFCAGNSFQVMFSSPLLQGTVVRLNYRNSAVASQVALPQSVVSLRSSPDGRFTAAGGAGGSVFLVDNHAGSWTELTGHSAAPLALTFSRCGSRLISGGGTTLLLWSTDV